MKARGLSTEAVYTSCDSDITVLSRTGCVGLSGPRVTLGRGWVCTLTLVPGELVTAAGSALWSPGTGRAPSLETLAQLPCLNRKASSLLHQ